MAEVTVVPYAAVWGTGWHGACTRCGTLPAVWAHPVLAAWDTIGHATTHHPRRGLASTP